ncbi:MAG TPA: M24 family metallopeptidase, partial [Anaerolineae bacterium]|nr:M24 family metallopeptidase [Anaerolineae bacterium]
PLEGHAQVLKAGEWVRHDYGGTYHSYWSDTGRTISLGEPSQQLQTYYAACRAGLEAIAEQLKPGARSGDLFALGIRTVRQAGISHYDRSHCGHCIGLEMYEAGGIKPNDELRLAAGMVLNVELPYYELGWGGLQIEDTFLITATGAERLTAFPHELIIH